MIPKVMLGHDKKVYSSFVYQQVWAAYERAKTKTIQESWNELVKNAVQLNQWDLLIKGHLAKLQDMVRALRHLGVQVVPGTGKLIKRRQPPEEHRRKTARGSVIVNKGLHKKFPAIPPRPMLALKGKQLRAGWITERKFDGVRAVTIKRGNDVKMFSRSGKEYTANFPEIVEELKQLSSRNFIIDGEIVYMNAAGNDMFNPVQHRIQVKDPDQRAQYIKQYPVTYFVFDILEYGAYGKSVEAMTLMRRKYLLEKLFAGHKFYSVKLTEYKQELDRRKRMIVLQEKLKREGVMHKDATSPYVENYRSPAWRKHKFHETEDVIVIGYEYGKDRLKGKLGALYTVLKRKGGGYRYTGKIGTGMTDDDRAKLQRMIDSLEERSWQLLTKEINGLNANLSKPELESGRWVDPRLVIEIDYFELSPDKHFRHGVFKRLREDKAPADVVNINEL